MKGLYHYQGMRLHYLTEDERWAVYYVPQSKQKNREDHYNPFRVYNLKRTFHYGWTIHHKMVNRYGDLFSAVLFIHDQQVGTIDKVAPPC